MKICRERGLFQDLINIGPGKSKNLKPHGSLHIFLVLYFLFRSIPQKLFSKVAILKNRQKHHRWISVTVAEHRPSYLNYAACYPWNFEADISQNISEVIYKKPILIKFHNIYMKTPWLESLFTKVY